LLTAEVVAPREHPMSATRPPAETSASNFAISTPTPSRHAGAAGQLEQLAAVDEIRAFTGPLGAGASMALTIRA
jgi:hypothetical protein